jgi:hypothetical protein
MVKVVALSSDASMARTVPKAMAKLVNSTSELLSIRYAHRKQRRCLAIDIAIILKPAQARMT